VNGVVDALYVADNIFHIPVQVCGDGISFDDLLKYLVDVKASRETLTHNKGVVRGSRKKKRRAVWAKGELFRHYEGLQKRYAKEMSEVPRDECVSPDVDWEALSEGTWWYGKGEDLDIFPERFGAPGQKTNIRFKRLWRDVCQYYSGVAYVVGRNEMILKGMSHDEACGWLMWMCATQDILGVASIAFTAVFGQHQKFLKLLNTAVKAFGLQRAPWGCSVAELTTLIGRGVGQVSPDEDVRTRINLADFLAEKAAVCDDRRLRACIREVLNSEMSTKPVWGTKEEYWTRRWLFTKSGSHSRSSEERWFGERLDLPPLATRREFAESAKECMVAFGEPRVDAGFSWKEEHGKRRAIYGCDTGSYYTFDYLLRPIEAVWRNNRVLMNPGVETQAQRYRRLAAKGGYRYMLDFDDYNSQHTLTAMRMVIEEACAGAPKEAFDWAVASWDNMYVHWINSQGLQEEKMVGTLPSGHRATTFVNTILNAAYCKYASRNGMTGLDGYHCGDDVIVFGDEDVMSEFVLDICNSPFRVNPAKQSVGRFCGEFLRVAFDETRASGYGARSISATVSGNWTTDNRLDKTSYVDTMLRNLWTLCSRFRSDRLGVLGLTNLRKKVPEVATWAYDLVTHSVSWNGSPVANLKTGSPVFILRSEGGRAAPQPERLSETYATQDMIDNHIDFALMEEAGITAGQVKSVMAAASGKPRSYDKESEMKITVESSNSWHMYSYSTVASMDERVDVSETEALNVLTRMFTKVDWQSIARSIRPDLLVGPVGGAVSPWPVVNDYELPYSDCMAIRRQTSMTVGLVVMYPVRV
jgi:hypothetical protein